MLSLKSENLLQNYYLEAGLWGPSQQPSDCHWGWESPTCQLRGHFLGHWLSAAAKRYAATGDHEIKGKADHIVAELARCQREHGGEWAGSIPRHYLNWVVQGKKVWAPHYTIHKTLMGLFEMFALAGNEQALAVLTNWAAWFHRWCMRRWEMAPSWRHKVAPPARVISWYRIHWSCIHGRRLSRAVSCPSPPFKEIVPCVCPG